MDRRLLRSVYRSLRRDAVRFDRDRDADPELLELVEGRYRSVDEVRARLADLEAALRERNDRRSVFLTIYTRMTAAVGRRIEGEAFRVPDWMGRYTVGFANYYRRAFLDFERGAYDRVPEPWLIAFGTSVDGRALFVQDAGLGINAHINYDLALAVRDAGVRRERERKHADHLAINAVLSGLVDAQQRALADLYARGIDDLDATFGTMDEALSLATMAHGRAQAWRVAVVMTDVDLGVVHAFARWVLNTTAVGGALLVLSPGVDPAAMRLLHAAERRQLSVESVAAAMDRRLDDVAPG